jgi:hypothetical protein
MSRGWKMMILALFLVAFVLWLWPTRGRAPDERIAAHFQALCVIADKGISQPQKGVERMFRYYGDHGPELARDWAELLVQIERIEDDRAHDERARKAARRLQEPVRRCERTLERFGRAIEADPRASELLERGIERLSRTLEIIFGARSRGPLDLAPLWPTGGVRAPAAWR